MRTIKIPYYTSTMELHVEEENLKAVMYAKADACGRRESESSDVCEGR